MSMHHVSIPANLTPYPQEYEVTAAGLLAQYLDADVTFVVRTNYKTPDFSIGGMFWELKSPTGNGKRTVQRNMQEALKQASNIVYDIRRSKADYLKVRRELQFLLHEVRMIHRLILITKTGKVIELKR